MNPIPWMPSTEDVRITWGFAASQDGFEQGGASRGDILGADRGPAAAQIPVGEPDKGVFLIEKASYPDLIQPWLLGSTAPNFPVRQLISEPSSFSSWASQKSILLTVPFLARSQARKQSPQSYSVGGCFPFLFCCSGSSSWARRKGKLVSYSTSEEPKGWIHHWQKKISGVVLGPPWWSLGLEMEFGHAQDWKIRDKSSN